MGKEVCLVYEFKIVSLTEGPNKEVRLTDMEFGVHVKILRTRILISFLIWTRVKAA